LLCGLLVCLGILRAEQVDALDLGVQKLNPVMVSAAVPVRQALIVAASSSRSGMRAAAADTDADEYRNLLRLLGFQVTTIGASNRPDLDSSLRAFGSEVASGSDVAIFFLGNILADSQGMFVTAADAPAGIESRPELFQTEGIKVSSILRRISSRGPREVVVIVDECLPSSTRSCQPGPESFPNGISAIVATHRSGSSGGAPMAAMASLRSELIPLMQQPGESFLKLFSDLQERIRSGNVEIAGTAALSSTFSFLPADFFQRLPHDCNQVSSETDFGKLRAARPEELEALIVRCQQAVQTWNFSTYFGQKLALAREQSAFRKAVAGCGNQSAANSYLSAYPQGLYRSTVEQFLTGCAPPPPPPPPPQQVSPPTIAQLQQRARDALRRYYYVHSSDSGSGVSDYESLYAPQVTLRNAPMNRRKLAYDKVKYNVGYPVRRFTIVEGTLTYECLADDQSCLVHGMVNGDFQNSSGEQSSNSFETSIQFITLMSDPKVTYECAKTQIDKPCN